MTTEYQRLTVYSNKSRSHCMNVLYMEHNQQIKTDVSSRTGVNT